jgi:hypothetical protein
MRSEFIVSPTALAMKADATSHTASPRALLALRVS